MLAAILISGFGLLLAQADYSALDAQNGFFDYALGASLDTLKGFVYEGQTQKKERYVVKDLPLEYAGVKFKSVHFLFYRKRLHSIVLRTEGQAASEALLELLKLFYGPGEQDYLAPSYVWPGKTVRLTYEMNLLTKNAEAVFESVEMQRLFSREWR
ncbi:MAG: hypothetical protein RMM53_03050 [Bacteroidia bacterium]|nr:hypothetical protein [Bacteroidia bacterium]MDW8333175.1 hypothetical protein [Bacteroidia bacterium]